MQPKKLVVILIAVLATMSGLAAAQEDDRPYMGIRLAPDGTVGIVVTEVVEGAPAEAAGITENDVLVTLEGEFLTADNALDVIGQYSPGDIVAFALLRDGETITVDLTFGTFPEETPEPDADGTEEADNDRPQQARLGVGVAPAEDDSGVFITGVGPDTAASEAGIEEGDIITAFDGTDVTGPEQLIDLIADYSPDDEVTVTVLRGDEILTLDVTLGAAPADDSQVFAPVPDGILYDPETAQWTVSGNALADEGLENGDVITAVNGEPVTSALDAFELLQTTMFDNGATLTVVRGDAELEIDVPTEVVATLAALVQ